MQRCERDRGMTKVWQQQARGSSVLYLGQRCAPTPSSDEPILTHCYDTSDGESRPVTYANQYHLPLRECNRIPSAPLNTHVRQRRSSAWAV